MMRGLYVYGQPTPFTRLVRVIPQQDVLRIIQRTLDGAYHVQIIGDPAKVLSIEVQVDAAGKAKIDQLEASGGLVTVVHSETSHGNIIDKQPWSQPITGQFRTILQVAVAGGVS